MRTPKVKEAPDTIWLNVGDIGYDCDFIELCEVTWSEEKMGDSDIEYRRVKRSTKNRREKQ